jgi:hypothetical protein
MSEGVFCPMIKGNCQGDNCVWWNEVEGGGCAVVWIAVYLKKLSDKETK